MIVEVLGLRYWVLTGRECSFYCKSIFRVLYFKSAYIGGKA